MVQDLDKYLVNQQYETQRAYINLELYQYLMSKNLLTGTKYPHQFQSHWFKSFSCLKYLEKNAVFYFPYYLFAGKPTWKPR